MMKSIGDLAMSFSQRTANVRIRTEMNTLAQELTSGLKADIRTPLAGDTAPIGLIERSLSNLSAYRTTIDETVLLVDGAQRTMSEIANHLSSIADGAFSTVNTTNDDLIANFGQDASDRFMSVANLLNGSIAGRTMFAGNDTDALPVGDGSLLLDDIEALIIPGATAQDVSDAVDTYFAPGGGYLTTRYAGSADPIGAVRISPDDALTYDITAEADELRHALAAIAKGAIIDRGVLDGQVEEQRKLIEMAGTDMLGASASVVALRGEVGSLESRLDSAGTRNATETDALAIARASLLEADPFETAIRLNSVQTQLDTFYTVTARLSQLSLTGYLR